MHRYRIAAVLAASLTIATAAPAVSADQSTDLGRQVLSSADGWAAADGGTTGGAAATDENVYRVSTWQEFRAALGGDDAKGSTTDRIVFVEGTINANRAADGTMLTCGDYAAPGYSLEAYLQQYDPETWGNTSPTGPLEKAREQSHENQDEQIRQYIGSNVTIVGAGDDAKIVHAALTIEDSDNVIVRNLEVSDAYDCFPGWDPGDDGGNWNSEFDNISIVGSTHVWIDHLTLNDGTHPPQSLDQHFGMKYEVHDGLLDITNGSDLLTVSWNEMTDHDKLMLIGNSDSKLSDRGKLRVTMHHNLFENTGQRTPRVRFGKVHVFNNFYRVTNEGGFYHYNWGVGVESQILAENNYFELAPGIDPGSIISNLRGTMLEAHGTLINGRSKHHQVDLVAEHNADHVINLDDTVNWDATLYERIHPTQSVPAMVSSNAGAGEL